MRVIVSLIYLQMVVLTSTPAAYAQEGELDNNTRLALANFVAEMVECSVYYAINGQLQDGFGNQWKMGKDYQKLSENMGLAAFALAKTIKIPPSERDILNLSNDLLVKHNALIFHKGSSLSSAQRSMVQNRIAYGLNRGTIQPEEVAKEINKLNALIQGELIKLTTDGNCTHEQTGLTEEIN